MRMSSRGIALALRVVLLSGLAGACSSSPDSKGPAAGVSATPGTCERSQIDILFAPMYSAFDGVHTYQVPAVVDGIDPSAITWSISDSSIAVLQPGGEGVMITVQKAGTATIVASAGSICGTSLLTVTPADPDDWMVGSARYNDGVVLGPGRGPGGGPGGGGGRGDAGPLEAACTSCHGDTATNGPFRTVSHTPQQTGGFSDAELIKIFTEGVLPPNAYFDETIVPRQQWSFFHRWGMTPEQAKGMVVYLRSLVPQSQKGMRGDFGGRRGDGGAGGGRRPDGGFGRGGQGGPDAGM
jgi:hypothetical protein